jgi:thiol-disulfide isomerase/thioredoxin
MNRVNPMVCVVLLGAALLLAGCNEKGGPGGSSLITGGDKAGGKAGDAQSADVQLDIASLEDVQKFVADQKGQIVVLDLWSSSCQPCVRELPGLVKLHEEHPDDVVCVSLNLDFYGSDTPEELREPARKILADNAATLKNFLSSTPDSQVYEKLEVAAVPVVFVYDRDGKLAKRFDNEKNEYGKEGFTYKDHIAPFVKELIGAKGS